MAVQTQSLDTEALKKLRRYQAQQRALGRTPAPGETREMMQGILAEGTNRQLALQSQQDTKKLGKRRLALGEEQFQFGKSQQKRDVSLQRRQLARQEDADKISGASDIVRGGIGLANELAPQKEAESALKTATASATAGLGQEAATTPVAMPDSGNIFDAPEYAPLADTSFIGSGLQTNVGGILPFGKTEGEVFENFWQGDWLNFGL